MDMKSNKLFVCPNLGGLWVELRPVQEGPLLNLERRGLMVQLAPAWAHNATEEQWAVLKKPLVVPHPFRPRDLRYVTLPPDVYATLVDKLGYRLALFLLFDDVMSKLDPEKLEQLHPYRLGGYEPLLLVTTDPWEFPEQIAAWRQDTRSAYIHPGLAAIFQEEKARQHPPKRPAHTPGLLNGVCREWLEDYRVYVETSNHKRADEVRQFLASNPEGLLA